MVSLVQKDKALEAIRTHGTMKAGAAAAGVSVRTLNQEMLKSNLFKRRVLDAREEGKRNIADQAIDVIKGYAFDTPLKTDRNKLTAAIALANAFMPGFRGATQIQGHIEHDVRVITAIPRPDYKSLPEGKKALRKPQNASADLGEPMTLIGEWARVPNQKPSSVSVATNAPS
jgi:hypothetical protein